MAMTTVTSNRAPTWTRHAVTLATAVGAVYLATQVAYAATGWGTVRFLPPVAYTLYLVAISPMTALWTCPDCGQRSVSARCRSCGNLLLGPAAGGDVVGLYVLMVPSGAAVATLLLLFPLGVVGPLLGRIPPLSGVHRATTGTFGFAGPVPFLLYTAVTAMFAAVVTLGIHTTYVWVRSARPVGR